MYNNTTIMGRICHDLELKTTPNGIAVITFRMAVDRQYKKKNEERQVDFFNVVAWRSTAEFIRRYFSKGKIILVSGEMQSRTYVDKENVTRTVWELIVSNAYFAGENKPKEQSTSTSAPPPAEEVEAEVLNQSDDDYPF